jgi:very-short-patch-repair endonuclease
VADSKIMINMTKIYNRSNSKKLRQALRQQEVSCERILWSRLKNRQLEGYKFRRQFGINWCIVDFYCPAVKLVIEVDGSSHGYISQIEKDKKRDEYLASLGITVKRYMNLEVKNCLSAVLGDIVETCLRLGALPHPPYRGTSPCQGEVKKITPP